jgi:uncharacterized membrane protein
LKKKIAIQDAASWILRVGVITSILIMTLGLLISFFHGHLTLFRIENRKFNENPHLLFKQIWRGEGFAVIELGILFLIFTPILRVAASVVLFALEEHDWMYTVITFVVLVLTLTAFFFLK